MRKLIQGTALLAVIVLVVACEEMTAPPTAPKAEPDTRLYTEIGAEELLERWSVLPNGAVAEAVANPSGRRLAAATDGFSGLPTTFRFSDAREYGACVVFTIEYEFEVKHGEAGPRGCPDPECDEPGEDIEVEVEVDEPVVITGTVHIIDCVGAPDAGNTVEGLFHVAHVCEALSESGYYTMHIIRAGDFSPTTRDHPERRWHGTPAVEGSIRAHPSGSQHAGLFIWMTHIDPEGSVAPVQVNWAYHVSGYYVDAVNTAGFDDLDSADELHFEVDHSRGVVEIGENDGAAWTEYLRRCESLSPK